MRVLTGREWMSRRESRSGCLSPQPERGETRDPSFPLPGMNSTVQVPVLTIKEIRTGVGIPAGCPDYKNVARFEIREQN